MRKMVSTSGVLGCCIFCFACIAFVQGGGKVQIQLLRYANHNGSVEKTTGGIGCCDSTSLPPLCDPTQCDPVIDICTSDFGTMGRCDSQHVRLPTYYDKDAITFNQTFLEFPFQFWGGAIFVKVTIADGGGKNFEQMVYLSDAVSVSTPVMAGETNWRSLVLSSNGISLNMVTNVMCDDHFRDKNCYCEDRNTTLEHTMCDRQGNRVCLSGWANLPKCLTPTSICLKQNPCRNNASCGTFTNKVTNQEVTVCTCPLDYSGKFCEIYTPPQTSPIVTTSTTITTTPTTTIRTTFKKSTTPSTTIVTSQTSNSITTQSSSKAVTTQSSSKAVTTQSSSKAVTTQSSSKAVTTQSPSKAVTTQSSSKAVTSQSSSKAGTSQSSSKAVNTQSSILTSIVPRPGAKGGGPTTPGNSSGGDNTGVIAGVVAAVVLLGAIAAALVMFRKHIFKTAQNAVDDAEKAKEEESVESPSESNQANEGKAEEIPERVNEVLEAF